MSDETKMTQPGGFVVPPGFYDVAMSYTLRPDGYPPLPALTRRQRIRAALGERWYDVRLAIARRLLPEHNFDYDGWD